MDLYQIIQAFPNEEYTYNYLEEIRWNGKVVCSHCKASHSGKRYDNFQYHCSKCRSRFSVLTKTYLHNTRMPLQKWFLAFRVIADAKNGISALQLHRNIEVSYETAFKMYHTIRDMMAEEKIELLEDVVEMDVGGKLRKPNIKRALKKEGKEYLIKRIEEVKSLGFDLSTQKSNTAKVDLGTKRGCGSKKPILATGIVQRDGAAITKVMSSLGAKKLEALVKKHVESADSLLITDTYKGYSKIGKIIEHIKIDHSRLYLYNGVNTNTIERFWAIVERGIIGQYHHVSFKYLPKYIIEFCFKYNNRNYDDIFDTLVKASMKVKIPSAIIHDPTKSKLTINS